MHPQLLQRTGTTGIASLPPEGPRAASSTFHSTHFACSTASTAKSSPPHTGQRIVVSLDSKKRSISESGKSSNFAISVPTAADPTIERRQGSTLPQNKATNNGA